MWAVSILPGEEGNDVYLVIYMLDLSQHENIKCRFSIEAEMPFDLQRPVSLSKLLGITSQR